MQTENILWIIIPIVIGIIGLILNHFYFSKNKRIQEAPLEYQKKKDEDEKLIGAKTNIKEKEKKLTSEENYRKNIIDKFQFLDFSGLKAELKEKILLKDIYVKLRSKKPETLEGYTSAKDFGEFDKIFSNQNNDSQSETFVKIFSKLLSIKNEKNTSLKFLLCGKPGSGKTTLMKWIALKCCKAHDGTFVNLIPVFFSLKGFNNSNKTDYQSKHILELLESTLKTYSLNIDFLREGFEANRILFLLDGLDEIGDEKTRKDVITWIENQDIRQNVLIVTSRFTGLNPEKGLKFHDSIPVFLILDFNLDDISLFLRKWYENVETAVKGEKLGKEEYLEAEKKADNLVTKIKDKKYENLAELATNPLLLTIIAIVHRSRIELPQKRHLLYQEVLKRMIKDWNKAQKNIDLIFPEKICLSNLSIIAFHLMKSKRKELPKEEIERYLPEKIENQSRDTFLYEMILKTGLIYESEGNLGFIHQTFQEYLVAFYFIQQENQNEILEFFEKDYWAETFKLFVNIGNPKRFLSRFYYKSNTKKKMKN